MINFLNNRKKLSEKKASFDNKKRMSSFGILFMLAAAIVAVSAVYLKFNPDINNALATSYSWTQSSWAGGSGSAGPVTSTTTAYDSADAGVSAGSGGVTLTATTFSYLADNDNTNNNNPSGTSGGQFDAGTCQTGCASSDANNAKIGNGAIKIASVWACGDATTDIDGNSYNTETVNSLCWFSTNLRSTNKADGSGALTYYYPNNSSGNAATYGLLYPGATVSAGNICPTGWRVPTQAELTALSTGTSPSLVSTDLAGYRTGSGSYTNFGSHDFLYATTGAWYMRSAGATNWNGFSGSISSTNSFSIRCVQ